MAMIEVDIALQLRWYILCRWFNKYYIACIYAVNTCKQQIFKKESQLQPGTTAIAFFEPQWNLYMVVYLGQHFYGWKTNLKKG